MASRAAVVRCSEVARRRARRGRGPSEAQEEQEAVPIHLHLHLLIPCSAASSRPPCPSRGRRRRRCLGEGRAIEVREARRERHREWGLQGVGAAGWCVPCSTPALLSTSSTSLPFVPNPGLATSRRGLCWRVGGPRYLQELCLGVSGASGPGEANPRAARALLGGRGRRLAAQCPQCLQAL